jgi:GNAT superfamily N-acetyltransferase
MYEPLVSGGTVRKVWDGETELYRQHLLRLDAESPRNRFGGAVSDEYIRRYADPPRSTTRSSGVFFRWRAARCRRAAPARASGEAEAALSIERAWQSRGVGSALFERVLLVARNRQIESSA